MPTIMSQNVVRPEDYKVDTTAVSDMPLTSMDSHHLRDHSSGNGRIFKDSTIATDSSQVAVMTAVTPPSKAPHSAPSLGSRHYTKTRPLAIQTISIHTIGKSSDNNNINNNNNNNYNNSNSYPNTANTEPTPPSTTTIPYSNTTPPSSTASSTSSTTSSPMSHIRRWTSSLSSSSKSNSKSTAKVRTIGPISAPQPLTTPVPYACTPLPYFDLPTPDHLPVSASAAQQHSPRSSPQCDSTVPRSPAKPATSCPDLPVGSQTSEYYSNVLAPIGTYSSLNRSQRTSWKDRLFNSNPKKQDRRASTNSNVDDDYEWSSNQEADAGSNSVTTATTTSSSTTPAAVATSSTEKQSTRPRMRISPPLTQPVLPANQKTVPIMQNPLMSPTDDLYGPDTFDPFKIAPKSKAAASGPVSMMMMMTAPADEVVLTSACPSSAPSTPSPSPSEQNGRPTVDTKIKPPAAPAHQLLTPPSSHASEESFPFASPTSSSSIDEDNDEATAAPSETSGGKTSAKSEAAVLDFAATLCEGLVSDFVMPPSYFDQHNLSLAFEDAYPRTNPDMMLKVVIASSPPLSPPSPRSPVSSRSSRSKFSQKDRSLKSTSTYSTDSDSSASSIESEDESSDDDSSLSPVSGASFFSTVPPTTGPAFKSYRSPALMKSGGIKIPSSLMTFLPTGSLNKSKTTAVSPSTTPPVSPPLAHAGIASSQMATLAPGAVSQTPPGMIMALADPRAMMLKRLAYIHTLRKLRERERRPFCHAVLLHLILLQLRRGITNKHCSEIAEFYVAMSAAQFPPRLDISNTMIMAQQQRSKLQQQQQLLSQQSSLSHIPVLASPIETVQESMIPVRSSSKVASTSTSIFGDKEPRSKRSLVFSLQSRNQANKNSSNNNGGESGWSFNSTTTPAAATTAPSQISMFKERLPLLRIPTYPLINLEKNSNNCSTTLTPSAARKNLAATAIDSASEDDQQGVEESNADFQPGLAQQVPTVILPKRTTGRKGLLYQQQLQLRMRQQMSMMIGGNGSADQVTGVSEQDQAWLQSQLVGIRPRFATSTFTTVRSGLSEVVTRPLVPLATVKTPPATSESSSAWSSFPFAPFSHLDQTTASTSTSTAASITSTGAITSVSQDGNGSLPAGLLTPPLSPLFRNPFSAATSTSTATPAASTGSVNNTNNSNNINTNTPAPLPPTTIPTTNNSNNKRSSYTAQDLQSPPSSSAPTFLSHHIRVVSTGSVSSYTLPHIQNSHHTISYLEGQAVHARSRPSLDGNTSGRKSPPPLPPSSASSLSRKQQQQQQQQFGLPSPPLSPTLDTDGNAAAMLSTVSASMNPSVQSAKRANLPQRSHSSGGYHVQQLGMMTGGGKNGAAAGGVVGGRSENIAWIMRVPSPVTQHDLQTRRSMEDIRNRLHWKTSSSTPAATSSPAVVSATAATASTSAVTVGRPTSKKSLKKSAKGGVFSPEESEEEDVPLAFVQRRISSDTLRSMA